MIDLSKRFSARVVEKYNAGPRRQGAMFRAAVADAPAEILIYDFIGGDWYDEGVTAKGVLTALANANGGPVVARINSPGGDVFEGMAIASHLREYAGGVTVVVDGLAASAASVIAMAGKTVTMNEGSMLMIHNAWTVAMGDRHDFVKQGETLGKIDAQIAGIYAAFSGKPAADFTAAMDAETWYTAEEAVTSGLASSATAPATKPTAKAAQAAVVAVVEEIPTEDFRTIRAHRIKIAEKF